MTDTPLTAAELALRKVLRWTPCGCKGCEFCEMGIKLRESLIHVVAEQIRKEAENGTA